jgi:hypothetical protein
MKPLSLIIAAFAILLSSCSNQPSGSKQDQAVPKALQNDEKISDIISSKRIDYGSLIEELYDDAVSKNPDLEKLEKELSAFNDSKDDSLSKVEKYKARSIDFYNSGKNLSETIADSTLKKKLSVILETSEKQYRSKTSNLNNLVKLIEQNEINIRDYHTMLKLMVTIPIIEKYQDQQLAAITKTASGVKTATAKLKQNTKSLADKYEKAKK